MMMRRVRTEIRAHAVPWERRIQLLITQEDERGNMYAAKPVAFEECGENELQEPTVKIDFDAAQQLMDELWRCGLRPAEGRGSAGAMAATENHLADMRTITMALLKKDGVQV